MDERGGRRRALLLPSDLVSDRERLTETVRDLSPSITIECGVRASIEERGGERDVDLVCRGIAGAPGAAEAAAPEVPAEYELVAILGEGGMGAVYDARERSLRRNVALKLMRLAALEVDVGGRRFEEEALVTASLDHPNVIPIHALGRDPEGRLFFTMKKVSGVSWNSILHPEGAESPEEKERLSERAARMSWRDHFEVLLKVSDAVAFAHSRAVLHRDLKPENVMIGEFGEVYVVDWGLAMSIGEQAERPPRGDISGTPYYMAPEMARGETGRFCEATDIHLLGGILHEIVSGRPPDRGTTFMQVLDQAARGGISPPDSVVSPELEHPALKRILMKALEPEIEKRYRTVREFQADLRGFLSHAESLNVARRAVGHLDRLRKDHAIEHPLDLSESAQLDRDAASGLYAGLSEMVGAFRQAIDLWPENQEASEGLLDALTIRIALGIQQGDLTLARSQLRELETAGAATGADLAEEVTRRRDELERRISGEEQKEAALRRSARLVKVAGLVLAALLVVVVLAVLALLEGRRSRAEERKAELFAGAVEARARAVEGFMLGIERTVKMYRRNAIRLLTLPVDRLTPRPLTVAGRGGFYYDEDFDMEATRPPDTSFDERYGADMSWKEATVVRAPWAKAGEALRRAEEDARRLCRLSTLFSDVHASRADVIWSIAGTTRSGLLVGFPGSGRFGNNPEYDPTERPWFEAGMAAADDLPVWVEPYADASTRKILMTCVARVRKDGETVGVVGLEVELSTIDKILLDFPGVRREGVRCLLLRPFGGEGPDSGEEHGTIVDTSKPTQASSWKEVFPPVPVEEAGEEIDSYYREVVRGGDGPRNYRRGAGSLVSHARFRQRPGWILIVVAEEWAIEGE